jgi:hypothetical protein
MATEILAIGTTSATSDDVTVADGEMLTVCLKDAAGPSIDGDPRVEIQLKDDDGEYFSVGALNRGKPAVVIAAAGTYRFSRRAGASCGVFSG